jgi:WD40 repeat protein
MADGQSFDLIRGRLSRIYQRSMLGDQSQDLTDIAFAPRDWGRAFRTEVTPVVALGGKGGQVELWDLGNYDDPRDDQHLVPPIKLSLPNPGKKDRWISRVRFNHKGRMLAFASGDTSSVDPGDRGGAWVWTGPESPGGQADLRLLEGDPDTGPVADIAFSPDGTIVATAGSRKLDAGSKSSLNGVWSGVVHCYNPKTGELLHKFALPGPARSVAFDRLGRRLVVASGDTSGALPHAPGQVVVCDWRRFLKTCH